MPGKNHIWILTNLQWHKIIFTTVRLSVRRSAAIQTFDKKEPPQVYVKAMHKTKHLHSVRHGPKSDGCCAHFGGANIQTSYFQVKSWPHGCLCSGAAERFWKRYAKLGGFDSFCPPLGSRGEAPVGGGVEPLRSWSIFVTDTLNFEAYAHLNRQNFCNSFNIFCCFIFNLTQRWYFN